MKKTALLVTLIFLSFLSFAQHTGTVKGTVTDTLAGQPLASATITVLQKKDSSLVSFTMTSNKGFFEVAGLPNGNYRLLITHVNYYNTNTFFTIDETHKQVHLGNIVMHDLSRTLDEVVVTAEAPPVTLVGDTIQYNAGSFKTAPNSNVEQLLKKMPGIKVEKDGTVKAQGQEVKKVLVDGKEFFGSDPKIATRNLPADAVDKVQVYDKLSDAAELTGFDDGNSEKTINLKLKNDKKKGLFGKATVGGGANDRYEGRFNVNSFKGARQFSAIGMGNNTNSEGFSFMDMLSFSGELNRMRQGGNGTINITSNDVSMAGMGGSNTGIRTVWAGGINYNDIIGNKTAFTSNYFYNRYNPKTESHVQRQYFLPDSSWFYDQNAFSDNINNSHRLNLGADIQIDSFHSIKISPSIGYQQTSNSSFSDYQTFSPQMQPGSEGFSDSRQNSDGYNFRNDLLFRKKFHRKGRTLAFNLQTSLNQTQGDGSLVSVNRFFNNGSVIRTDSINQRNTTTGNLWSYNARLVYTEPVFKRSLLEFSAGRSNNKSSSEKITYNFNNQSGKFDELDERLTNDFENTYGYTTAGIRLRTQHKKYSLAIGANWQQAELEGRIMSGTKDSVIGKSFTNLLPNARFQYKFSRYRSLTFSYSGSTNQPSLSQLQPVPDISDPLNIQEGNPDLEQEYSNNLQVSFMSVDPFRNKNLFAFFTLRQTNNKIVNYDTIDAFGVKTTRPVNVDGVFDINGTISLGLPVRFLKGTVNISTNGRYNKGRQFINTVANEINTLNLGPEVRLDMTASEKMDLSLSAGVSYYTTTYSLQPALNNTYFNQQYGADVNWQLPKNFYFSTEFTYSINSQRAEGFNTSVPLWNASISKQFLRFNRGELKLSAFDLLNQNIGISRSTSQNYIEDKRVTSLQRFFLLSFTYSLSKNGLGPEGGRGSIRIIRR